MKMRGASALVGLGTASGGMGEALHFMQAVDSLHVAIQLLDTTGSLCPPAQIFPSLLPVFLLAGRDGDVVQGSSTARPAAAGKSEMCRRGWDAVYHAVLCGKAWN